MRRLIVGAIAALIVAGLGIYAVETTIRVKELQREDELAQDSMNRIERALIRLDARMFGPVGQVDLSGDLGDGAPQSLPVDEIGKWSSVFVWPKDRQANGKAAKLAWLFRNPRLQGLLDQTIVAEHVADTSDPLWRDIYGKWFDGNEVQFWLLKPRASDAENYGTVVYKVSGANLPDSPEQMANDIQTMIDRAGGGKVADKVGSGGDNCPRPFKPKPVTPTPTPVTTVVDVKVPDVTPKTEEEKKDDGLPVPWGIVVAAAILAALAGYGVARKFSA